MMADAKIDEWMNPASHNVSSSTGEAGAPVFFNPVSWMNMFFTAAAPTKTDADKKS